MNSLRRAKTAKTLSLSASGTSELTIGMSAARKHPAPRRLLPRRNGPSGPIGQRSPTWPSATHRRIRSAPVGVHRDLLGRGLGEPAGQVWIVGSGQDVADAVLVHP